MKTNLPECFTVAEVAAHLRIGEAKVRAAIRLGKLAAIDIGLGVGRRSERIEPAALAEFKKSLAVRKVLPAKRAKKDRWDPEIAAILGES
jgi:hypothetical protein